MSEDIKEAAEMAMQNTGFVYEKTSGLYYDYNSGYYYNAVSLNSIQIIYHGSESNNETFIPFRALIIINQKNLY